jgi:hypothetical protein
MDEAQRKYFFFLKEEICHNGLSPHSYYNRTSKRLIARLSHGIETHVFCTGHHSRVLLEFSL